MRPKLSIVINEDYIYTQVNRIIECECVTISGIQRLLGMGFYQAEKLREKWIEEGFLLTGDVPTINLKRKDDFKSLLINEAKRRRL